MQTYPSARITRPAYFVQAARTASGGSPPRWWAEIEISGRVFAACGETLREVAEKLREKADAAGLVMQ